MTRRTFLISTASLLASARLSSAQQSTLTFSSEVNVVDAYVTVRDKKGRIVTTLNKEDFVLSEDGRPQEIRYFSRQSDLPLTLGLIIDATPSETNMLEVERQASYKFLEQVLRPEKDRGFIIRFSDDGVDLLQDLTGSREKLERALGALDSDTTRGGNGRGSGNDREGGPGGPGGGGDNTLLSDAIYLASNDVLRTQSGRKAVIILGDGDHIGNRGRQAILAAQQANCIVYAIRIFDQNFGANGHRWRGLNFPGLGGPAMGGPGMGGSDGPGGGGGGPMGAPPSRSDGKKRLQEIASQTGGAAFEVTKKQPLDQIYSSIEEELRNQYSLGYKPDENANAGYRKIKVQTKESALIVQCRDGYYPAGT